MKSARQVTTRRSNFFHYILSHMTTEQLNEFGISPCKECGGNGLGNCTKLSSGDYSWDGYTYCKECSGTGYKGYSKKVLKIDDTEYYCSECLGDGCNHCNYTGRIDWIGHIMGR